jgi:hypothetical protein
LHSGRRDDGGQHEFRTRPLTGTKYMSTGTYLLQYA